MEDREGEKVSEWVREGGRGRGGGIKVYLTLVQAQIVIALVNLAKPLT